MKKITTHITVAALLFLLSTGCNHSGKSMFTTDNQIKFDTLLIEKKHFLRNDTSNPFCELNVEFIYPIESSKVDLRRLQQLFIRTTLGRNYDTFTPEEAINQYANNFVKNYETDAKIFDEDLIDLENHPNLIPQSMDEIHEEELQSNGFYSYHETLTNKVHFNQSNLLSFQVNQSNNKGGSAVYGSYNNYVINLKTADLLSENDIFTPGYDVALQQLFANNLLQQNGVKSISDLEDLGYFGIQEIMPNRNFLIDNEGITYTFNKGEYSAYPLSAPVIFIPFNDLKMLLKKNTIVSKLAGL
ncbi:MAG: RsiV family protein [Dysgonamonadaceae bacterium]|jgi:hypothetical protein|nr:RsiV family protein [Dysgonamonadaceae bacterium]MDD3356610.1 RsiV family protein [Dysgonamonadaceae bacterium]